MTKEVYMGTQNDVFNYLSVRLRNVLLQVEKNIFIREIRLRADRALMLYTDRGELFIGDRGRVVDKSEAVIVSKRDIKETLEYVSNYSLYAYEEELKNGFITMPGGNRVGVCGRVLCDDRGVKTIRNISFVNIRIAHQLMGCSNFLMEKIYDGGGNIFHTLIVSPPGYGKTTLLRDVIRNLSDGYGTHGGMTVGVADERSEIAACNLGVPQNDVGERTDVMDACPKSKGMIMLIRSMGPQVIAVDEIGEASDVQALRYCINCGCRMVATIHAVDLEELYRKPAVAELLRDRIFERIILLGGKKGPGSVAGIFDGEGRRL